MELSWYQSSLALIWADYTVLVIVGLFAALNYKRFDAGARLLVWLLWFALGIESGSKLYLLQWIGGSNHYLLHLYTTGEFWLLSLCYRELLQLNTPTRKRFTQAAIAMGVVVSAYSILCLVWPGWLPSESV